jgi:hypothetical protein
MPALCNRFLFASAMLCSGIGVLPLAAGAQWSATYESAYLPGKFNWQFRKNYPAADRLFNAFDYGHAILYEILLTEPDAPVSKLEDQQYTFITRELLVNPPHVPLEEAAIEVAYAKLAPEAKNMFDWAHLFHRQVYDVLGDERMSGADKDAKIAELLRYYKSRRDLAFSSHPKTMELMEAQPYSLAFRKAYPKFNGLIWAYHWLQVGLYEPLIRGSNKDERETGVLAAVARFRQMIENPPANMPRIMPMTAAIAPTFAARYPEAAIIFDNLHSMHDVVSDILANPNVPRGEKRARIIEAARRYRDSTTFLQSVDEWREMAQMMGVENMGGPAVGFLAAFPTPTVERGAVMAGMHHSAKAAPMDSMPGMQHEHGKPSPDSVRHEAAGHMEAMMELHMRMMADSVIRARVLADTAMRRMMTEMIEQMPAEHREHMREMLREPEQAPVPAPKDQPPAKKPATPKKPPAKPKDAMPGMDHSKMPGMKKP